MTDDDEAAFDEFLAARSTSLPRTAILVCGATRHDAEDLVQHALEKVYKNWPRIRRDNPEAYAKKVVVNAAISRARRRKVVKEITFARPPETAAASPDLDLRDTLMRELRRLPPKMRAVLVLRYWEDQSEQSTAALLGCSAGTVKSQAARGLARMLRDAGLVTAVRGRDVSDGLVLGQSPPAGTVVGWGSQVTITLARRYENPQDLGDLGDGRAFGGIRLGYLPEGLVWGKWSAKDRFGVHSYTTTFAKPDADYGVMSIQVFVFEGKAAREAAAKFPEKGAESVDVGGRQAWLASVLDSGEVVPHGTVGGLLTIGWELRDGLAVEVCMSPDYAKEVDGAAELKKIAEQVRATK